MTVTTEDAAAVCVSAVRRVRAAATSGDTTSRRKRPNNPGGREYREQTALRHKWAAVQGLNGDRLTSAQLAAFRDDLTASNAMTQAAMGPLEGNGLKIINERQARALAEPGRYVSVYQNAAADFYGANNAIPKWIRIHHLALARVHEDGHATFASGELADLLGIPNKNIKREIQTAISNGLVMHHSTAECVVIPVAIIRPGSGNKGAAKCEHNRAANRANAYPSALLAA